MIANLAMSLLSALPMIAGRSAVPVWHGTSGIAFDLVVMSLVAPFMTTFVVTLLTRRRLASGVISAIEGEGGVFAWLPAQLVLRSLASAVACALIFASAGIAALGLIGVTSVPTPIFLAGKVIFIIVLVILITPPLVRAALCQRRVIR